MEEIWREAQYINPDGSVMIFEGYEVSNLGRVKSYKGRKEKILKPRALDKLGHLSVILCKDKKIYCRRVHRLTLSTFNPEGYFKNAVVDHIDSNPSNNRLDNLRWVTQKENSNTEHHRQAMSKVMKGNKNGIRLSCVYDGRTFSSYREAYWYAQSQGYTKTYATFGRMIKRHN